MSNELKGKIDSLRFENDSRFLRGRLVVCHDGVNLNNSSFDKDVLMRCAERSLRECPILGSVVIDEDTEQPRLNGHDMEYDLIETPDGYEVKVHYIERIYGFIPHDANISLEYNEEKDKNYIVTDCVLWRNYLDDVEDILGRQEGFCDVSMEISVNESHMSSNNILAITDFDFLGVTMLNDSPAMVGSHLQCNFSMKDIKVELQEMIKAYSKGGENVEENKVETEEFAELNVVKEEVETVTIDGEVVEEVKETTEIKEIIPDEPVDEPVDEPMPCDYAEEVEDVAEEFADDKEDKEEPEDEEKDEEEKPDEYAILKEEYEALKVSYAQLEEKLNAMSDYEELKAFKENADRVAYEKEVEEVAHMFNLDADEVNELKVQALAKEISIEQFKEKLGYKFAMKQIAKKPSKVVESSEMEIVDNTINSDAPYCGRFEKYRNKK